ncbi:hypothetical protein A1O5_08415 [Neofusicoccum parvum]|nr:hypothetical protein A1O5_08415 [Neofusicoccum parvum]
MILPQYHSQPQRLRIICAGAGAAGLLVAYRLQKELENYELICYDKNPDVGGTWYENRYPGCACDLPAHGYVYPFEPNPNWSHFYAHAPEILQYFKDFADKYNLHPFIQLNTRVLSAVWSEEKGTYDVEVDAGGQRTRDWCHIFVNGCGFLNNWKWPNIPGLSDFAGTLLHSANWDTSANYDGKRVAVIGNGSSGIQIIPNVQKSVFSDPQHDGVSDGSSQLQNTSPASCAARPGTIFPPVASELMDEASGAASDAARASPKKEQHAYTEDEKQRFRDDPAAHLAYRKKIEFLMNDTAGRMTKSSAGAAETRAAVTEQMHRKLGPGNDELKRSLIPDYMPGCRRITPGDGYLEALVEPNVTTVIGGVGKIVPEGVVDETGRLHEVDVLVCATGFNIAFAPPFSVKGVDGVDMAAEFTPEPKVYLALTVPKFPNYFVVNGPRGNWAAGSVLASHDAQVTYITKCLKRIQEEGVKAFEVKQEPVDQLQEHADEWHKDGIWSDRCRSWYKNGTIDGKVWVWPGAGIHYVKTVQFVRWEHYEFRYHHKNMWAFLGSGYTKAQVLKDESRLSPYVRNNDDVAWYID